MTNKLIAPQYFCGLLALSSLSAVNADVLGQWTFNNTPNMATALQSSAVASGAFVSSLAINKLTPFPPPSGPATGSFNSLHPKANS